MFEVKTTTVDVTFDPHTNQQFLAFNFMMKVSLPLLLEQILEFQNSAGLPSNHTPPVVGGVPRPPASVGRQHSQHSAGGAPVMQLGASASMELQPAMSPAPCAASKYQSAPMQQPSTGAQGVLTNREARERLCQSAPLQQLSLPASPSVMTASAMPGPAAAHMPPPPLPAPPVASASPPVQAGPSLDVRLNEAIRTGNNQDVQLALRQGANSSHADPHQHFRTPLHYALQAGGNISIVNMLLQEKANPNAQTANGTTPLHLAVQHFEQLPSLVIRMLLCGRADLTLADARGATPLDGAKMVAMQLHQNSSSGHMAMNPQVRILLSEMTERPTLAVNVFDSDVGKVEFADTRGERIVYHTPSIIGVYNTVTKEIISEKKLRQLQVRSAVKKVSVNPELGTIAACLEIVEGPNTPDAAVDVVQNVSIVWPTGQLLDEEPLKLNIKLRPPDQRNGTPLPIDLLLSRTSGPQMLLSRLGDGQVYCWRLNAARSQLISEVKFADHGGLIAMSDDGLWTAVVNNDAAGRAGADPAPPGPAGEVEEDGAIDLWTFQDGGNLREQPRRAVSIQRRAACLAVSSKGDGTQCLVAVAEVSPPGLPAASIEVLLVGWDGQYNNVYRVRPDTLCVALHFCYRTPDYLLSAHADGMVIVYDLRQGTSTISHDSPSSHCISISPDRQKLVSAQGNFFRVFRVSSQQ